MVADNHVSGDLEKHLSMFQCGWKIRCVMRHQKVRNRSTSLVYHHDREATVEIAGKESHPQYNSELSH